MCMQYNTIKPIWHVQRSTIMSMQPIPKGVYTRNTRQSRDPQDTMFSIVKLFNPNTHFIWLNCSMLCFIWQHCFPLLNFILLNGSATIR